MDWAMEEPAKHVAARLSDEGQELPTEILKLDDASAAIIIEVGGVDYVLTMARVPKQRPRASRN